MCWCVDGLFICVTEICQMHFEWNVMAGLWIFNWIQLDINESNINNSSSSNNNSNNNNNLYECTLRLYSHEYFVCAILYIMYTLCFVHKPIIDWQLKKSETYTTSHSCLGYCCCSIIHSFIQSVVRFPLSFVSRF